MFCPEIGLQNTLLWDIHVMPITVIQIVVIEIKCFFCYLTLKNNLMRHLFFLLAFLFSMECIAQTYSFDSRLTAFDKEPAEFYGTEVDIHETLMIVGAPNDGVSSSSAGGSAYIYEQSGGTWNLMAKIRSNDSIINVNFGAAVAISNDFAIIGDPDEADRGASYIFEKSGSSWTQIAKVEAIVPTFNDRFGDDVEIDGDWIFIGAHKEEENAAGSDNVSWAGSVFVYSYDGDDWNFNHKMVPSDRLEPEASTQQFGFSLAADGGKLIVGAYQRSDGTSSDVGAVYFFEENGGVWTENVILRPGDGVGSDFFGWDVDLKGSTAVVGALNHDFDLSGSDFKGESGAAYFMTYNGTTWLAGGKLVWSDRDNGDYFGSSVAVTPDEEKIIVGMYEDNTQFEFDGEVYNKSECGAAVVFTKDMGGVFNETQRITPSIKATSDRFGNSMAASNTSLVIAAYQDDIENFPNSGLCNLDSIADNGAVDLFNLEPTIGLANLDSNLGISIYPNPTSDYLNISSFEDLESVEILNLEGRILRQISLTNNQKINTTDLQSGFYFLRINQRISVPFIKY